jgi:hypothetical protein
MRVLDQSPAIFETRGRFGCDPVSCGVRRTLTPSCKEVITQRAAFAIAMSCRLFQPSRCSNARQDTRAHILPGTTVDGVPQSH